MLISLDYDNCYNRNADFWNEVIALAAMRGVQFVICTYRAPSHQIELRPPVRVYYTSGAAKREFLQSNGVNADIFIDDKSGSHLLAEWQ